MNCANHPERTATAFCQNCGKPLCPECIRSADGLILCEPCLLARQPGAAPYSRAASEAASGPAGAAPPLAGTPPSPGSGYAPVAGFAGGVPASAPAPPYPGTQPSPFLAGVLGFIPGVGAMYNGQFVKALLHVVIFIVLIGASEHFYLAAFLIPAWVFYQVFDAAQTAAARRDGRPLPDPFGILDMSQRLGPQNSAHSSSQNSFQSGFQPGSYPSPAPAGWNAPSSPAYSPAPGAGSGPEPTVPPTAAHAGSPGDPRWESYAPGYPPQQARAADPRWTAPQYASPYPPRPVPPPAAQRRGEPVGAIVLIVVGLLFLLSTLGVLDVDWISRGWPLLVLLLGIWLLVRRATAPPQYTGAAAPPHPTYSAPHSAPPAAPGTALVRNPLSISPQGEQRDLSGSDSGSGSESGSGSDETVRQPDGEREEDKR